MGEHKSQPKAYLFAVLAVLFWSTVATAFKLTLRVTDFIDMLFWASISSTLVLLTMTAVQGKLSRLKFSGRHLRSSLLMGFLNPFLYYLVLFKAYSLLPAQIAQPLNYTWPIALVLLSAVFLKTGLTTRGIIALLISFIGVVVVSMGRKFSNVSISPWGIVLAISSAFIWSAYWILNLKDDREPEVKLFANFVVGTVLVAAVALVFAHPFSVPATGIIGSIYIGIFEMGITFFLWLRALELAERQAPVANLIYLSPFISLVFINRVLGERILPTTVVGLALIVLGIIIQKK